MKYIYAIGAAVLAAVTSVNAQFSMTPNVFNLITNTSQFVVGSSNAATAVGAITTGANPWVQVNALNGFTLYTVARGTNAALVTNIWLRFEVSCDGARALTVSNDINWAVIPRGNATNLYMTNITAGPYGSLANIKAIRFKNFENTNGAAGAAGDLLVEKLQVLTR